MSNKTKTGFMLICASFIGVHVLANDKLIVEGDLDVEEKLVVLGNNGVVFKGDGPSGSTPGSGSIPDNSGDPRFMWYPAKAALRFGDPGSTTWDDANIGLWSTAWASGWAKGDRSTAWGSGLAEGDRSTAWGNGQAEGGRSTAWGYGKAEDDLSTAWSRGEAWGARSTAWGLNDVKAIGDGSTAWGFESIALGYLSTVWGTETTALGVYSTAWGHYSSADGDYSTAWAGGHAIGNSSTAWASGRANGDRSTAWGIWVEADSYYSTALGKSNIGGGDPDSWVATDPLLEVGIGGLPSQRANAFTILKNGNIGIGEHQPEHLLVVAGSSEFRDIVRIPPSGDLLMGDFTAGDNPSE